MGVNYPRGVANLDSKGIVGRIYVGDHITMLHTKSVRSGPQGSLAIQLYINI